MAARKKNKGGNRRKSSQSTQNNNTDFDLRKSLGKLNQRKSLPESFTSTDNNLRDEEKRPLNSDYFVNESLEETQLLMDINNRFSDKFDSLRCDIHIAEERISKSTDNLRSELETKIDKKVSRDLFFGAVSALILIASIIYILSYSHLEEEVEINSTKSINNDNSLNEIKETINSNEEDIEELEKKVYKLEIE